MIILQNNVEVIDGAKNHCIYDLNSKKLYHIDDEYKGYIDKIQSDMIDTVPKEVVKYLLNEG